MKNMLFLFVLLLSMQFSFAQTGYKADFDAAYNMLLIEFDAPIVSIGSGPLGVTLENVSTQSTDIVITNWNLHSSTSGNTLHIDLNAAGYNELKNIVSHGALITLSLPSNMVNLDYGPSQSVTIGAQIVGSPLYVETAEYYTDTEELAITFIRDVNYFDASSTSTISIQNVGYDITYPTIDLNMNKAMDPRILKIQFPQQIDTAGLDMTLWRLAMGPGIVFDYYVSSNAMVTNSDQVPVTFTTSPIELNNVSFVPDDAGVPRLVFDWNHMVNYLSGSVVLHAFDMGMEFDSMILNETVNYTFTGDYTSSVGMELSISQRDLLNGWISSGYMVDVEIPYGFFWDNTISNEVPQMYYPLNSAGTNQSTEVSIQGPSMLTLDANGAITESFYLMGPNLKPEEWTFDVVSSDQTNLPIENIASSRNYDELQVTISGNGFVGTIPLQITATHNNGIDVLTYPVSVAFIENMNTGYYINGPSWVTINQGPWSYNINGGPVNLGDFDVNAYTTDANLLPQNTIYAGLNGSIIELDVSGGHTMSPDMSVAVDIELTDVKSGAQVATYTVEVQSDAGGGYSQNLWLQEAVFLDTNGAYKLWTEWSHSVRVIDKSRIRVEAFETPFKNNHKGTLTLDRTSNIANGIESSNLLFDLDSDQYTTVIGWFNQGYFVKFVFEEGSVEPSDSSVESNNWYESELNNGRPDPSAAYIDRDPYFQIGANYDDYITFPVYNPLGTLQDVIVESVTTSSTFIQIDTLGFNTDGYYVIRANASNEGEVLLEVTLNNGTTTSSELLMVNVTPDVHYDATMRSVVPSEIHVPTYQAHSFMVEVQPIPWVQNFNVDVSAASTDIGIVSDVSVYSAGYGMHYIDFYSNGVGQTDITITIVDANQNTVQRVATVYVDEYGPGTGPGEFCGGVCINNVVFEYDKTNSSLILNWNEEVQVTMASEIILKGYNEQSDTIPSGADELRIPIPAMSSDANGRMVIDVGVLGQTIKRFDLSHHDVRVQLPSNVFKSNLSSNYYNGEQTYHFNYESGDTFELYNASYMAIENQLELEFDGVINPNDFDYSGVIYIGHSATDKIEVSLKNATFDNDYGDPYGSGYSNVVKVMVTEAEAEQLNALEDINNLYIEIPTSTFVSYDAKPLANTSFADANRLYYGTEYGDNWIEKTILDVGNSRLIIVTDRPITSVQDVPVGFNNGSTDSLFLIFGIDLENIDSTSNGETVSTDSANNGDDPPPESDPKIMYIRNSVDIITIAPTKDTVYIAFRDKNLSKIRDWKNNYADVLLNGYGGGMIVSGSMKSEQDEILETGFITEIVPYSLDFSVKTNGGALYAGALDQRNLNEYMASLTYTISTGGVVIDSGENIQSLGHTFFGELGTTYTVSAHLLFQGGEYSVEDTVVTLSAPSEILVKADKWKMISNGGVPFNVGALGETEYLYKWDESQAPTLLFDKYTAKEALGTIPPGQSFWYLSESEKTLPLLYTEDTVSIDLVYDVEGWNQVANPYNFDLKTEAFGDNMDFFKWNGEQYFKVNYLKPGEGYWTSVNRNENIVIDKVVAWTGVEAASLPTFKKASPTPNNWEMGISLKSANNQLQDIYNTIGVKPLAENGIDDMDKSELPGSMGDAVVLSFMQNGRMYRSDYKSEVAESAIWRMNLGTTAKAGVEATLEFDGLEQVRSLGYSVYLVNGNNKTEITSKTQQLQLDSPKEYSLVVSEGEFTGTISTSLAQVSNFPNPVRNSTNFQLDIKEGAGSLVHLRVFDIQGNVVYETDYSYGNEMNWNATSNSGEKLETGMYFYEIKTGAHLLRNQLMILD